MRLLYVAMTRATARVVLPYFFKKTKNGAPHGSVGGKNPLAQLSAEKRPADWPLLAV
mgnify:CR=1 FL=1